MASANSPLDRSIGLPSIVAHLNHPENSYVKLSDPDSKFSMLTLSVFEPDQTSTEFTTIQLSNSQSIKCLKGEASAIRNIYSQALKCRNEDLTPTDLSARSSTTLPNLSITERLVNAAASVFEGDILLPHQIPKSTPRGDSGLGLSTSSSTARSAPSSFTSQLSATVASLETEVGGLVTLTRDISDTKRSLALTKIDLTKNINQIRRLSNLVYFTPDIDEAIRTLGRTIHQEYGVVRELTDRVARGEAQFKERADSLLGQVENAQRHVNAKSVPDQSEREDVKLKLRTMYDAIEDLSAKSKPAVLSGSSAIEERTTEEFLANSMNIVAATFSRAQESLIAFSTTLDLISERGGIKQTLFSYDRDTALFTATDLGTTATINNLRDPRLKKAFVQTGTDAKGKPIGIYCKEEDKGKITDLVRDLSALGDSTGALTIMKKELYSKIVSFSRPPL